MSYSPILNNWKNRDPKRYKYDEYVIEVEKDLFLPVFLDWAEKNEYRLLEQEINELALMKYGHGALGYPLIVGLICSFSKPIHLYLFWFMGSEDQFINGNYKGVTQVSGKLKPIKKEVEALVRYFATK